MDGTHKPDQATQRATPRSTVMASPDADDVDAGIRNIGDQETTAAAASLSAQPVCPSPSVAEPRQQTSYFADERASARRRLAAPFALDGAYGAPWQRMSYRTTDVRNPV